MGYRETYKIDTIMTTPTHELAAKLVEFYPHGYCGIAKNGWPVYIEKDGMIKVKECIEHIPEDIMLSILAKSYENLQRHIMMACSHAQGK